MKPVTKGEYKSISRRGSENSTLNLPDLHSGFITIFDTLSFIYTFLFKTFSLFNKYTLH